MAWVRFTADMDWKPKPSVTVAYLAGMKRNVPSPAAAAAIAAGKAVRLVKTHRHSEPQEIGDDG